MSFARKAINKISSSDNENAYESEDLEEIRRTVKEKEELTSSDGSLDNM